jgi:prepilin peptidase CpaA
MQTPALLCACVLGTWLLIAAASDIRSRRIPNWAVAGGMLCGLGLHAVAPSGQGLFSFWWGGLGIGSALLGLLAGLALFLPLRAMRVLGAGDVKLLAMVGAWVGPQLVVVTTLLTLLAGGVMAVVMMFATGSGRRVMNSVRLLLTTSLLGVHTGRLTPMDATLTSGVRLPYAVAIAAGTLAQVVWLLSHAAP